MRPIHSENSTVFGVVADKKTMDTCSVTMQEHSKVTQLHPEHGKWHRRHAPGSMMMTSSQTTPRSVSLT